MAAFPELTTLEQGQELTRMLDAGEVPEDKVADARAALTDLGGRLQAEQAQQQQQQQQAPPPTALESANSFVDKTKNFVGGALDFAGMAAVGAGADVAGGLSGLGTLALGGDMNEAAQNVENVRSGIVDFSGSVGRLDNETLQKVATKVTPVLQQIEEGIDTIAMGPNGGGSPAAGAFIKTAILGLPEILGLKTGMLRAGARSQARRAVQKQAEKLGVNLKPEKVTDDFVEAATARVSQTKGEGLEEVAQALKGKRDAARASVDAKFDAAKVQGQAFLNASNAEQFGATMRAKLLNDGFDLEAPNMKGVRDTLNEIDNLRFRKPGQGARPDTARFGFFEGRGTPIDFDLNDWELIRRRVNKRLGTDGQTNTALNATKHQMDEWLDGQFNNDMIRGDAGSVARWKDARQAHVAYRQNFRADRTIKNLVDKDANPEQIARWIQGANAANAGPQAAATVKRLGSLLGKQSNEFNAVKMNVLHDVMAPMFKATPQPADFRKVVTNIDNMFRKNPSLVRELGLDVKELEFMRATAKAMDTIRPSQAIVGSVPRAAMRFLFGHGIAKAGLKVLLAGNVADRLFKTNMATRKSIMNEIADIPDFQALIPRGSTTAAVVLAQEYENALNDEDKRP